MERGNDVDERDDRQAGPTARRAAFAAALLLPSLVAAQARLPPVRVEAAADTAEAQEADAPSFVTVVPVGSPSARAASVAELIEREAGVRVRSIGGLGAFTSVSIRGADASEVAIFLDGVRLNRAASAAVDLSQVPADALERVEVYRGLPPPELGGQALGGAINLVTRKGARAPAWRASLGGGDFGTRSATLGYGFGGRALHADASLAWHGSDGNFSYYDYGGTPDPADDRVGVRRNNGFDQVAADVSLGGRAGESSTFSVGSHGFIKSQGVPGRGFEGTETHAARFRVGRLVLDGAMDQRQVLGRAADLRVGAHLLYERATFDNSEGELVGGNAPARTDGETVAAGVEARLLAAAGSAELFTGLLTLGYERFTPHDLRYAARPTAASSRLLAALVLADDVRLLSDRLAITPTLRFEAVASELAAAIGTIALQAVGQKAAGGFIAPQLGLRYRALTWLTLKGSVGRYQRVPTTLELFGDGAFFLPRPSLRPETATAGDLGGTIDGRLGPLSLFLEADFFGRIVADYIAIVPSAHALSAANVGDQRFLGAEARLRARLYDHFGVSAGYTFIRSTTVQSDSSAAVAGKVLPGVPEHKLDARADIDLAPFHLFYEVAYTGDVWLDPQNVEGHAIPGRALHAVGGRAGPWPHLPLSFSIEVRNLANLRVIQLPLGGLIHRGETTPYPLVDFLDYPLPGRAVYLTLAWQP